MSSFIPRAFIESKDKYKRTLVKWGATLGSNYTILCGNTIGQYAMVAAGAVVTRNLKDYALVAGVPAKQIGWLCQCGHTSRSFEKKGFAKCQCCGKQYELKMNKILLIKE